MLDVLMLKSCTRRIIMRNYFLPKFFTLFFIVGFHLTPLWAFEISRPFLPENYPYTPASNFHINGLDLRDSLDFQGRFLLEKVSLIPDQPPLSVFEEEIPATLYFAPEFEMEAAVKKLQALTGEGSREDSDPYFFSLNNGTYFSWNSEDSLIKSVNVGFYTSGRNVNEDFLTNIDLKDLSKRKDPSKFLKDEKPQIGFTLNANSTLGLTPKTDLYFEQEWSRYRSDFTRNPSTYDQGKFSQFLTYEWSSRWKTGLGYEAIYETYNEQSYGNKTLTYVPRVELEFKPLPHSERFKNLSFKLFEEIYLGRYSEKSSYFDEWNPEAFEPVRSWSRNTGIEAEWEGKGFQFKSGFSAADLTGNLQHPEEAAGVYSSFIKVKKNIWIGRLPASPFASWKIEYKNPSAGVTESFNQLNLGMGFEFSKFFEVIPRYTLQVQNVQKKDPEKDNFELNLDFKYHILEDQTRSILIRLGYLQPSDQLTNKDFSRYSLLGIFLFQF